MFKQSRKKSRRSRQRRQPQILQVVSKTESLQARTLLSSVTFNSGKLEINLTGDDSVEVKSDHASIQILIEGKTHGPIFSPADISSFSVVAGDGDNLVDISSLHPINFPALNSHGAFVRGGGGDDTVIGSRMADTIHGGHGDDLLLSLIHI